MYLGIETLLALMAEYPLFPYYYAGSRSLDGPKVGSCKSFLVALDILHQVVGPAARKWRFGLLIIMRDCADNPRCQVHVVCCPVDVPYSWQILSFLLRSHFHPNLLMTRIGISGSTPICQNAGSGAVLIRYNVSTISKPSDCNHCELSAGGDLLVSPS